MCQKSLLSLIRILFGLIVGGGIQSLEPYVTETFVVNSEEGTPVTYQITSLDEENHTGTVQLYGWYGGPYIEDGYDKHRYVNAINNVNIDNQLTIPSVAMIAF